MNENTPSTGGGARQPPVSVLLILVVAIALLAGAISGAAVALLGESSDSGDTASVQPAPTVPNDSNQDPVPAVVSRALPSVVAIINELENQGEDGPSGTAGGAGVIVDERGYILTNAHLVQLPGRVFVLLSSGEVRPANVVSHDAPFTDVGVVKIDPGGLQALPVGDSNNLQVGETVIAIGSPDIDYYNSVSRGVVSGLQRRKQLGNVWLEDLIQTDAAINVGNSGGPLLNLRGEVVGLNTFRDLGGGEDPLFGISFAISSRIFAPIVQSMIANGSFPRPHLGVDFVDLTPEVAQERGLEQSDGALIEAVTPGSPADAAGVQAGDIVTHVGEIPLSSQFGLLNALGVTAPTEQVTVQVLREGQTIDLDVQLEPR